MKNIFKRRLCALRIIKVGTRASRNCRCLIKFCWWSEEAAMCRDVHQGLHDLCCHACFFFFLIATHYLALLLSCYEQNSAKIAGFHSEANGIGPIIDLWTDIYPCIMTARTLGTYLLPFFWSTLKIIFHLINGVIQHDIFTGHFHGASCKVWLYTMTL